MPHAPFALALLDFLAWLLDATPFVTRGHCGGPDAWPPWMRVVNVGANLAIGGAYLGISICLAVLWRRGQAVAGGRYWILAWFVAFIGLCGTTHVADAVVFQWAPYRLYTLLDFATAVASVGTLGLLPPLILQVLRLPSHDLVHQLNTELQARVDELALKHAEDELLKAELGAKLAFLSRLAESDAWMHDKRSALSELRSMLSSVSRLGDGGPRPAGAADDTEGRSGGAGPE